MKILIGADLVPTKENEAFFAAGDAKALVGQELLELLQGADYRIFNLEVPLTDTPAPIEKCGPHLRASTAAMAGYKALGADLLTLANNHILDHGEQGLLTTLELLEKNGIETVGAERNALLASLPGIFLLGDKKIGVYACAEHEFSIAGADTAGANAFDPLECPDRVAGLKTQCDYVIVLYHGGKEHYRYPSPGLQKVCRKLVQKGADLVICQHSHCIGCEEKYLNGTIVYGQGNFLFDRDGSDFKSSGMLLCLQDDFSLEYIPFVREEVGVRLASGEQAQQIMDGFFRRSNEIKEPHFIQQNYADFAMKELPCYLMWISSANVMNILRRILNKLTGGRWNEAYVRRKYSRSKKRLLRNLMECETRREMFLAGLKEEDLRSR